VFTHPSPVPVHVNINNTKKKITEIFYLFFPDRLLVSTKHHVRCVPGLIVQVNVTISSFTMAAQQMIQCWQNIVVVIGCQKLFHGNYKNKY
jgi:hypothetical protein